MLKAKMFTKFLLKVFVTSCHSKVANRNTNRWGLKRRAETYCHYWCGHFSVNQFII